RWNRGGGGGAAGAMGVEGAMNRAFLAAVKSHGGPGAVIKTAYGTIPAHVNPPEEPPTTGSFMSLASAESRPAPAPHSSVQVASAGGSSGNGGVFRQLFCARGETQPRPPTPPP